MRSPETSISIEETQMSACSCSFTEAIGIRVSGPHIARKRGHFCSLCGAAVEPGRRCVDAAWLDCEGGGGFVRYHVLCWHLEQRFKARVCGYQEGEVVGTAGPSYLEEMAGHAVSEGHDPFWRDWLLIYEMAWDNFPTKEE
jgi:hypothetical protein